MIAVGLTGSIAMGKSEVARIFRDAGFPVFDSDAEVHKLYDSPEGAALIASLAPAAVVDGKVDRPTLTSLALNDRNLLAQLEPLVHAEIQRRQLDFLEDARKANHRLALVDVPLLFETGKAGHLDHVIVVSAPQHFQRQRAMARPGMTEAKLDMILARQMPDAEKRRRAGTVISNTGSLADLAAQTRSVIKALLKGSPS